MRCVHFFSALSNCANMIKIYSDIGRREPYQRDDLRGLGHQLVGEVLVVGYQIHNVDVAIELVQKRIVFELVSVDKVVVDPEAEDEGLKLHLDLDAGIRTIVECRPEGLRCVHRSRIHDGLPSLLVRLNGMRLSRAGCCCQVVKGNEGPNREISESRFRRVANWIWRRVR